jgi:hypothetical protein
LLLLLLFAKLHTYSGLAPGTPAQSAVGKITESSLSAIGFGDLRDAKDAFPRDPSCHVQIERTCNGGLRPAIRAARSSGTQN